MLGSITKWLKQGRAVLFRGQRGFTLIEAVMAVGILGALGAGLLMALNTNSRAARTLDEQVTGINLATAYFEVIRQLHFSTTDNYSSAGDNIDIPPQYNVDIAVDYSVDGTTWVDTYSDQKLQRITIIVSRDGGKQVRSICTYKLDFPGE